MRRNLLTTVLAAAAAAIAQPVAAQGPVTEAGTTGVSEPVTTVQPGVAVPGAAADALQVVAGPQLPTWFVGPAVGRDFEREQFFMGVQAGRLLARRVWGQAFANLQLARTGQSNGTLWTVAPGVGVVPNSLLLSTELMVRLIGHFVYNRFSSDFASGSDLGVGFSAGLLYGINESYMLAGDVGAQRVAGFSVFLITFSVLFGSVGSG